MTLSADVGLTHFVMVPSPLLGGAVWEPVATELRRAGHAATVAAPDRAVRTPRDVVESVLAVLPDAPVVLVPHSNAGLSAPAVDGVAATVYVDAALPPADAPETLMAKGHFADFLRGLADQDGVLPVWTEWWDEDLAPLFPDARTRARVERQQQRLPLAYFADPLPLPAGWADRPAAYLAFGDTYADEVAFARARHWPVSVLPGGHLEMLRQPRQVADEVRRLAAALLT